MSADKETSEPKAASKRGTADKAPQEGNASSNEGGAGNEGGKGEETASLPKRASELASNAMQSSETLINEASNLVATVRQGQEELGERLSTGTQAKPYLAIGAAAGIGYVLGGGLTLGLTRRLVLLGGRFAVSMLVRRVVQNAGLKNQ